jgi:hypothetical protein
MTADLLNWHQRPAPLDPDDGWSSSVATTEFCIWPRQNVEPEETMATFKPSPQMRRMQIVALLMLVASGIVAYPDRSAFSIANIEVRQELGLSATAMGVLLSAFLMSYAFSQLPAGILVDRVGPRILLGAGLVISSLARGRWASSLATPSFLLHVSALVLENLRSFRLVHESSATGFMSRSAAFPRASSTRRPASVRRPRRPY